MNGIGMISAKNYSNRRVGLELIVEAVEKAPFLQDLK
jgi:hypothetical protein